MLLNSIHDSELVHVIHFNNTDNLGSDITLFMNGELRTIDYSLLSLFGYWTINIILLLLLVVVSHNAYNFIIVNKLEVVNRHIYIVFNIVTIMPHTSFTCFFFTKIPCQF